MTPINQGVFWTKPRKIHHVKRTTWFVFSSIYSLFNLAPFRTTDQVARSAMHSVSLATYLRDPSFDVDRTHECEIFSTREANMMVRSRKERRMMHDCAHVAILGMQHSIEYTSWKRKHDAWFWCPRSTCLRLPTAHNVLIPQQRSSQHFHNNTVVENKRYQSMPIQVLSRTLVRKEIMQRNGWHSHSPASPQTGTSCTHTHLNLVNKN